MEDKYNDLICKKCKYFYDLDFDLTGEHNCCCLGHCYLCNGYYCDDYKKGNVPKGKIRGTWKNR